MVLCNQRKGGVFEGLGCGLLSMISSGDIPGVWSSMRSSVDLAGEWSNILPANLITLLLTEVLHLCTFQSREQICRSWMRN